MSVIRFTLWSPFGCLNWSIMVTQKRVLRRRLILTLTEQISRQRRHVFLGELGTFVKLLFLIKYSIQNHLNLGNVILSNATSHSYPKWERIAGRLYGRSIRIAITQRFQSEIIGSIL